MSNQREKLLAIKDKYEKYSKILKIVCVTTTSAKTVGVPMIPIVSREKGILIRAVGNIGFAMRLFLQYLLGNSFAEFQQVLGGEDHKNPEQNHTNMLLRLFIIVYSIRETIETFKGYTGKKYLLIQVTFFAIYFEFCTHLINDS